MQESDLFCSYNSSTHFVLLSADAVVLQFYIQLLTILHRNRNLRKVRFPECYVEGSSYSEHGYQTASIFFDSLIFSPYCGNTSLSQKSMIFRNCSLTHQVEKSMFHAYWRSFSLDQYVTFTLPSFMLKV